MVGHVAGSHVTGVRFSSSPHLVCFDYLYIQIPLDGIQMPDLSFDHVHWYLDHEALSVKNFNGTRIYVATPTIFDPSIDAACGSKYGAQMSLSALFNPEMVRMIRSSHTFRDFIGVIHLPGHGSIWIHGDRENLTNAMTSLPLKKPDTV